MSPIRYGVACAARWLSRPSGVSRYINCSIVTLAFLHTFCISATSGATAGFSPRSAACVSESISSKRRLSSGSWPVLTA